MAAPAPALSGHALNSAVQPLLTDMYQITMAYANWRSGKQGDTAVFDLFFRKAPFGGEFTIFVGLTDCLAYLEAFRFSQSDLDYLRQQLPDLEPAFFDFLKNMTAADVSLTSVDEGSVVFPRVPLMTISGPLIVVQLLETTLLNLVNYASLIATNAARYRLAAGPHTRLLEFGLRRAQGPDGAMTASRCAYIGGFDATSNVLAGKQFGIPCKGTHAHSYVSGFTSQHRFDTSSLAHATTGQPVDLLERSLHHLTTVKPLLKANEPHEGELRAFIAYALAFPSGLIALIDTYDVLRSGLVNFCAVALALYDAGYTPVGIRIDSGDLAYLSTKVRQAFAKIAESSGIASFADLTIIASNDINEETIYSLNDQGHEINYFGIGTHLVTCQRQPALGCVFKLVELNGAPTIKLSEDIAKVTFPGRKALYRLYSTADGRRTALVDLMARASEAAPEAGREVLCRHPFTETKRAWARPAEVVELHRVRWAGGAVVGPIASIEEVKANVVRSLDTMRQDHKRNLNPTPYKSDVGACDAMRAVTVSVSDALYKFMHDLWLENQPIGVLY